MGSFSSGQRAGLGNPIGLGRGWMFLRRGQGRRRPEARAH